jgi:hypothetical protein
VNVYAKLQQARIELQSSELKKSGNNKFAGYNYFELSDFLPHINEIFHKLGLFSQISFTNDLATLTIVNTEKPDEQIVFTSPMAEANLKGCHPIQNLGAVETYNRRYLYVTALEIVEHDALDATHGKDEPKGDTVRRETVKAKFFLIGGDKATDEAFDEWEKGQLDKGFSYFQMNALLTKKLPKNA